MSESTGEGWGEWERLPIDGADSWLGVLLLLGSGTVSIEFIVWLTRIARQAFMQ